MDMFGNWGNADLDYELHRMIEERLRRLNVVIDSVDQIRGWADNEDSALGQLLHLELGADLEGNPIPVGNRQAVVLASWVTDDPVDTSRKIRVYTPLHLDPDAPNVKVFPFGVEEENWFASKRDAMIAMMSSALDIMKRERPRYGEEEGRVLRRPVQDEDAPTAE